MASVTGYQGEATPHGDGLVSLASMQKHHNLEQIGNIIEHRSNNLKLEDMLDSVKKFVNHLQREGDMDNVPSEQSAQV